VPDDRQRTLDFGAQEFVDLQNDALDDVGGVDLVFDVVGGDIQQRSARLIRAGGSTTPSRPSIRPSGSAGRRSSALVRERHARINAPKRQMTEETIPHESDHGDGPGCGNGRDDAGGAGLPAMIQRRTRTSFALGILVAILCVVAETLLTGLVRQITPVDPLGVIYLLGVMLVASVWGFWLGMATALVSTIALDYFFIPPTGSLIPLRTEVWAVLTVFGALALMAWLISKLTRSLAVEVDTRAEADLARILLHAPDVKTAQPEAARRLARAFKLPFAAIQLGPIPDDENHVAFPLHDHGVPVGSLLVPTGLPRPTLRRLQERVVPSIEVLLQAARERQRITDEQAALRRLATHVARGAPPDEIFGAVAREVGYILEVRHTAVVRYEPDATVTVVGVWNPGPVDTMPLGSRFPLENGTVTELVARTEAPGRIDAYGDTLGAGEFLTAVRGMGINSAVGCPVTVDGSPWGAVCAGSASEPLPEDTEKRMLDFTDLVATAIANADSHAKLQASRARVLAAADATRRLIERDLHDGTQQRLVAVMLELRAIEAMPPADPQELRRLLSGTTHALDEALEDLRGIARGLHPALLSRQGLQPAIKALARCSPVPVELNMCADRHLAERSEVTAYHVVSEALTNAARHADASVVHVDLSVKDATIWLSIRDDGKGGADPGRGSGLLNITDRVEALGGRLQITSPAGGGTSLLAEIPNADV
jgi:signal transduction histidine kinase